MASVVPTGVNMLFISLLAVIGGLVTLLFVDNGPFALAVAPFDWRQVIEVFKNRGVRLASFGYWYMWELYAMWIWAPVMIRASLGQGSQPALAEVASFLVIACGAIGCVVAGLIADRVGRTIVTSVAMAISGSCCLNRVSFWRQSCLDLDSRGYLGSNSGCGLGTILDLCY